MVVGTGSAIKTWHLPKELLVNASPFFTAALDGPFSEATSRKVTLPEDEPDAFALFVRWLYVGKIGCMPVATQVGLNKTYYAVSKTLVQACIFGDKLGCLTFQDLAMLELIKHHTEGLMRAEVIR